MAEITLYRASVGVGASEFHGEVWSFKPIPDAQYSLLISQRELAAGGLIAEALLMRSSTPFQVVVPDNLYFKGDPPQVRVNADSPDQTYNAWGIILKIRNGTPGFAFAS